MLTRRVLESTLPHQALKPICSTLGWTLPCPVLVPNCSARVWRATDKLRGVASEYSARFSSNANSHRRFRDRSKNNCHRIFRNRSKSNCHRKFRNRSKVNCHCKLELLTRSCIRRCKFDLDQLTDGMNWTRASRKASTSGAGETPAKRTTETRQNQASVGACSDRHGHAWPHCRSYRQRRPNQRCSGRLRRSSRWPGSRWRCS
mmetsp:Transcript_19035/g.60893  ORF Transcript_19035/g.60893 Transcript_19035/m.60893 type:complete len:203 (+) Transcript_19035:665-1273(+)